jgi:transposase-like protein
MDLARTVYSLDLKITAMRALDAGTRTGEIARKYQLTPKLLERWRGEWRAKGEAAFPGIGHRGTGLPALDDVRRIADLERKIGQLKVGPVLTPGVKISDQFELFTRPGVKRVSDCESPGTIDRNGCSVKGLDCDGVFL